MKEWLERAIWSLLVDNAKDLDTERYEDTEIGFGIHHAIADFTGLDILRHVAYVLGITADRHVADYRHCTRLGAFFWLVRDIGIAIDTHYNWPKGIVTDRQYVTSTLLSALRGYVYALKHKHFKAYADHINHYGLTL